MFPGLADKNFFHVSLGDSEFSTDLCHQVPVGKPFKNQQNFDWVQFRGVYLFSVPSVKSTLIFLILNILLLSSDVKMTWVHAPSVANAFMKHE